MQRTQFGDMACSIARTLDVIGEPWSPLILRDVFVGITRFDKIQADLGISRKVLTERLKWLVESGVLQRRQYETHPPRYEYRLTDKGREIFPILATMAAWADRWMAGPEGSPLTLHHTECDHDMHAEIVCSECGERLEKRAVRARRGPGHPAASAAP